MTASEIAEFFGFLVGAWGLGFTGGYLFTTFKNAIDRVT